MVQFILYYWLVVNVWTFCVFGFDKHCARAGKRRVSERRLWRLAWLGGSLGAWLGMWAFRHKTQHKNFVYGVPAVCLLQLLVVGVIGYVVTKGTV